MRRELYCVVLILIVFEGVDYIFHLVREAFLRYIALSSLLQVIVHRHVDALPQLRTGQLLQFIRDTLMDPGSVSIVQDRHLHNGNVAVSSGLY